MKIKILQKCRVSNDHINSFGVQVGDEYTVPDQISDELCEILIKGNIAKVIEGPKKGTKVIDKENDAEIIYDEDNIEELDTSKPIFKSKFSKSKKK